MDFSLRFLFMFLFFTPVAVMLGLLRPFWGLCMLCFLYFFRPGIWSAPDWFRPWNWITLAVSVGWLLNAKTIRFHPIMGCALLFVLAYAYAGYNARVTSEVGIAATITIAKLIWIMWLTLQLVDTRKKVEAFFWANFLGMLWNLKTVLYEGISSGGQARVNVGIGQGGGANYIALIVNLFIPFLFMKLMYGKTSKEKKFAIFMLPLWMLSLVFTGSRSGLLGLGAIFGYVILRSKHKFLGIFGSLFLALLVIIVMPSSERERFVGAFKGGEEREGAAQSRIVVWGAALKMFSESPVHGVGPDNFQYLSFSYTGKYADQSWKKLSDGNRQGFVTHNTWLQTLAEGGLLAILPYLAMFFLVFWSMHRARKTPLPPDQQHHYKLMSYTMEGLIIAFMVSSTFGSQIKNDALWWFMALVACIRLNARNDLMAIDMAKVAEQRQARKDAQRARIADRARERAELQPTPGP